MNIKNVTLLGSLAVFLTLAGCEKSDDAENTSSEIKLGARVAQTKAPVNGVSGLSSIGVYGIRSNNWVASPWINNDQSTVTTAGVVTLSAPYFYPAEGDAVHFYAYHPYAATGTSGSNFVTAPTTGTAPVLNFTITGQEDIMYSSSVSGSKSAVVSTPLTFDHALTQLKFTAKTGASFPASATVTSITFNSVNTKSTMDISNGTLSTWGTPSNAISSAIQGSGAISTTSTASNIGGPVMLEPGLDSFNVTIITSFGTFSNISIVPTGGDSEFIAGKAYTVELTFTATGIELSTAVSQWENTGTGEGSVE